MFQRFVDVAVAAVGLALSSPLLAIIAVSIRLDDRGPVMFVQVRAGCGREPFRIYKFRTMRDARVTRVGAWLRATGLDELPQLVNVLRGDMGLIGPRPLTATDIERLGWEGRVYDGRWSVRPGIVGLAQLHAGRGARLSWFLDRAYVARRSPGLDLGIVAMSALIAVVGKRRVRGFLRDRRRKAMAARALARSAAAQPASAAGTGQTLPCTRPLSRLVESSATR